MLHLSFYYYIIILVILAWCCLSYVPVMLTWTGLNPQMQDQGHNLQGQGHKFVFKAMAKDRVTKRCKNDQKSSLLNSVMHTLLQKCLHYKDKFGYFLCLIKVHGLDRCRFWSSSIICPLDAQYTNMWMTPPSLSYYQNAPNAEGAL